MVSGMVGGWVGNRILFLFLVFISSFFLLAFSLVFVGNKKRKGNKIKKREQNQETETRKKSGSPCTRALTRSLAHWRTHAHSRTLTHSLILVHAHSCTLMHCFPFITRSPAPTRTAPHCTQEVHRQAHAVVFLRVPH